MATSTQSNPVYYSLSTDKNPPSRTVVLNKRAGHNGFGVYLGEDVPSGLYIVTVERNSPAADANIQPGDRVLAVNGQLVSSMSGNPKDMVVKAATNSESLTLTIQSTDIFQTLNIPLINNYSNNNKSNKPKPLSKQTSNIDSNLEKYIQSLFANENVQIVPSSSSLKNNEFIITSNPSETTTTDFSSYPSRHSYTDGHKQEHQRHHHRRRRHPKQTRLETKATQTVPNDDDDDDDRNTHQDSPPRPYSSHPTMGTPVRLLRTQQTNESNEANKASQSTTISTSPIPYDTTNNSSKKSTPSAAFAPASSPTLNNTIRNVTEKTNSSSQHMADVVGTAVAASRSREQPNNREQTSSREPVPVNKRTDIPPSSRQPLDSRASVPVPKRSNTPPPNHNPPPYTTVADVYPSSEPINNSDKADRGSYNVRNAQENRALASTQSEKNNIPTSTRGEGLQEVHLHRSPDFQGFGFHLQYNKSYYLVHRVEEGSPAEESGLRANDVILKINQQTTDKMSHGLFVQIVNATSDVDFLVQPLDEYLRSNPVQPRNPQAASTVSAAINEQNDKRKSGISKALGKLNSR